jgi:choline dehydrogenase-like flavoprotein
MPKAIIDWRVSAEEIGTIQRYTKWLHEEFDRLGVDGIGWHPNLTGNGAAFHEIRDTNHLMGGTTMGADPSQAVVDTNLRVHGISNLFMASLSTFPSGGSSNPTFTLIALSLRLADQLKAASRSAR